MVVRCGQSTKCGHKKALEAMHYQPHTFDRLYKRRSKTFIGSKWFDTSMLHSQCRRSCLKQYNTMFSPPSIMKCNYCLLRNRIHRNKSHSKVWKNIYEIAKIKLNCTATENKMITNTTDTNERRPNSRLTRNKKRQHKKPKIRITERRIMIETKKNAVSCRLVGRWALDSTMDTRGKNENKTPTKPCVSVM